jgi:hypothetical protein
MPGVTARQLLCRVKHKSLDRNAVHMCVVNKKPNSTKDGQSSRPVTNPLNGVTGLQAQIYNQGWGPKEGFVTQCWSCTGVRLVLWNPKAGPERFKRQMACAASRQKSHPDNGGRNWTVKIEIALLTTGPEIGLKCGTYSVSMKHYPDFQTRRHETRIYPPIRRCGSSSV